MAAGKAVWDYVDRNYAPRGEKSQIEHMKDFSRLGGQIGANYHILEGFAYGWSDDEIRDFVDYSNKQGVRVLFWRHSNRLQTPEEREEFFKRLHDLGVAGAKIDFIDQETKEGVDLYEALLANGRRVQVRDRLPRRQQTHRPTAHVAQRHAPRSSDAAWNRAA